MKITFSQYQKMAFAIRFLERPDRIEGVKTRLRSKGSVEQQDRFRFLCHTVDPVGLSNVNAPEGKSRLPVSIVISFRGIPIANIRPDFRTYYATNRHGTQFDVVYNPELEGEGLEIATEITEAQVSRLTELRDLVRNAPKADIGAILVRDRERALVDNENWPQPAPWDLVQQG